MLPKTIVGIDIETTDLDPQKGDIIEVAALRYSFADTTQVIDRFTCLCKPTRLISAEITALTGINDAMVAQSRPFAQVLPELAAFIGDDPVFAHNASFDVGWLDYNGLSIEKSRVIDTYRLAMVAWPEAESYSLSVLSEAVGIKKQALSTIGRGPHSAEYDVEMAWRLVCAAQQVLVASPETYPKIIDLLDHGSLGHYKGFFSKLSSPAAHNPYPAPSAVLPLLKGEKKEPQVFSPYEGEIPPEAGRGLY